MFDEEPDGECAVEIASLREGEIMGVYLDFDRYADPTLTPAEFLLRFGVAVSAATVKANRQRLRRPPAR